MSRRFLCNEVLSLLGWEGNTVKVFALLFWYIPKLKARENTYTLAQYLAILPSYSGNDIQLLVSSVIATYLLYALQLRTKFNSPCPYIDATGGRMLTGIIIFIVHKLSMNIHSGPPQNPQVLRPCPVYITEPYTLLTVYATIAAFRGRIAL